MDYGTITQVITSLGFPIVMCIAMSWYVKYITDKNRDEVRELNAQHNEEIKQITVALNNNTIAIQTLCDKLNAERVVE